MDFIQRDMTFGGNLINKRKASEVENDICLQITEIFNENEYVVDDNALGSSDYIVYLNIPKTRKIIGYCLFTIHEQYPAFLIADSDFTYEKISIPCIYINQLAMRKKYAGKGIAAVMYADLMETYFLPIYSHVSICNKYSMKFHFRMGFKPVGEFVCENFHGLSNYFSFLLKWESQGIVDTQLKLRIKRNSRK